MSYPFRTTYRQDADTYIEDRGYAHVIARGHADFATLDGEKLKDGWAALVPDHRTHEMRFPWRKV